MSERLFFIGEDGEQAAFAILDTLGGKARSLLAEVIEHQGVMRTKASAVAMELEKAGFVFIRDKGNLWTKEIEITPSLMGEEALDIYEEITNPAQSSAPGP